MCVHIQVFRFLTENFLCVIVGIFYYRSWPQIRTLESSLAFWSEFLCFLLYNSMPGQNLKAPIISPNRKRHLLTLIFCVVLIYKNVHLVQNVLTVLVFLLGLGVSYSKVKKEKSFFEQWLWFFLSVLDTMSPLKYYQ